MARICDTCGRGSNRAINRSHSNVATKREQHINLQTRRIAGAKAKICTKCLKTLTKSERTTAQAA